MPRFITLECASIEARHVAAVVARVSVSLHFGRFPKSLTPQPRLNLCARRGVPVVVGVAGSAKHTLLCSLVGTFYEWYVPAHDFLFHTARTDMQTARHPSRTHTLGTSTSLSPAGACTRSRSRSTYDALLRLAASLVVTWGGPPCRTDTCRSKCGEASHRTRMLSPLHERKHSTGESVGRDSRSCFPLLPRSVGRDSRSCFPLLPRSVGRDLRYCFPSLPRSVGRDSRSCFPSLPRSVGRGSRSCFPLASSRATHTGLPCPMRSRKMEFFKRL